MCMREYKISLEFSELQIDTRKFFQMSEAQREKVVKRSFCSKVTSVCSRKILE